MAFFLKGQVGHLTNLPRVWPSCPVWLHFTLPVISDHLFQETLAAFGGSKHFMIELDYVIWLCDSLPANSSSKYRWFDANQLYPQLVYPDSEKLSTPYRIDIETKCKRQIDVDSIWSRQSLISIYQANFFIFSKYH